MVVQSPSAPSSPSALQPSRRTVVGAGLIAVPAVTMLSAAPAYAAASDARTFTITTPSGTVPANGQVTVTVRVLAPNGAPLTARPISLVGPSESTFTPADGVTNGAGTFTTRFRLNKVWAAPGSSTMITAISESGSGSATFTVLGANLLFQQGTLSTQTVTQFSSPIVRAQNGPGNELVLLQDGTVWRRNTGSNNPYTQVAGISDGADLAISSGSGGTFYVLKNDGTVWAWGANEGGQVGDGTTTNRSTPVQAQISGVTKISAANGTLFAVTSDKLLWAVGYNNLGGMAGIGAESGPVPFTQVSNGTDVVDVMGRPAGGVLVKTDGTVWAWGRGSSGYNGDGTTADQPAPVQITTLNNITSLAGGITAVDWGAWTLFALTSTGTVYAWGYNAGGAYGDNTTTASPTPVQISGVSGVTQITTSNDSVVFALKNDGTLLKWGGGASTPAPYTATRPVTRLGNANNEAYSGRSYLITAATTLSVDVTQVQVAAGTAGTVVATVAAGSSGVAGANVTLATTVGTLAATSGSTDSSGVLQTTVTTDVWTTPGTVGRVTAADDTGTSSDTFTVLGSNLVALTSPIPPVFSSPVVDYSMLQSIAVLADGSVWRADGSNWVVVPAVTDAARVSVTGINYDCVYVLKKNGTIVGWGMNNYGQLGDGTTEYRSSPVVFQGLSNVTQIQAGQFGVHALKSDGTVWYQGSNVEGRGGVGPVMGAMPLTQVELPGRAVQVVNWVGYTAGAVLEDGTVWTWGRNNEGQLADGTTTQQNTPVKVLGLSGITALAGSATFMSYDGANYLALKNDGTVWSWGRNEYGQLGYGGTTASYLPAQVPGIDNVTQIATSPSGSYALKGDGTFLTWGIKSAGGNGFYVRATPTVQPVPRPTAKLLGTHGHSYNILECPLLVTTV